jgi:hypothetical protein
MKFFKIVVGLIGCTFLSPLFAQTSTNSAGIWTDATIWSAGIPGGGTITANINHPVEINTDIAIGTTGTGVFNIFQNLTDFPGGVDYVLEIGNNGTLDVQGGTSYFGAVVTPLTGNSSVIRVRNGATLILNGDVNFRNGTTVSIESGGTLIINGNLQNNIQAASGFVVEGTVQINGGYSSSGDVDVIGGGQFFTTGAIDTSGGPTGTVFGSPNNCGGPCSGQNLCFGGNSNVITTANQYLCSGQSAVALTADAIGNTPSYRWQMSTTSATSGFIDIPGAAGATQNYNPGTPTQTTWYRRFVTNSICTTGGASNAKVITIISAASWKGGNSDNWNDNTNWCGDIVPGIGDDVVLAAGLDPYPIVYDGDQPAAVNNLTISSGASLSVAASNQITIAGNFTNNGTAVVSGTANFTGSTAQTIGGSGFSTFGSVTVNNTSGATPALTLPSSGLNVATQLTLTAGKVNLSNSNLTIGSASGGVLSYAGGWLYNGTVTRWLGGALSTTNSTGLFPIGSSTDYRPIFFGNTNLSAVGTIRVSHTAVTGSSSVVFTDNGTPVQVRSNSFWTVASGNGIATSNNFSIRTEGTGFGTVADVNHLRLTLAGSAAAGIPGTNAGSLTNPQVNRSTVPLASLNNNFYWGSIDATNTPLPIELISFTATLNHDVVALNWSTASELNNKEFAIERAIDLENFETVVTIPGNGTTNVIHHYNTIDPNPVYGRSYYRLKQTDYSGEHTYSDVRVIDYEGPKFSVLKVYPNPTPGDKVTIIVTGLKDQTTVPIVIFNVQGQLVFEATYVVETPGTLHREIEFANRLKAGVYVIKAGPTLQLMQKLVVE